MTPNNAAAVPLKPVLSLLLIGVETERGIS
jgi:hypothetical protein